MKISSVSLVISAEQIKAIMRYHCKLIAVSKLKRLTTPSVGEEVGQLEFSSTASGKVEWCHHFKKQLSSSLNKINIRLQYDSIIPSLGICPKEMKTYVLTRTSVHSSLN